MPSDAFLSDTLVLAMNRRGPPPAGFDEALRSFTSACQHWTFVRLTFDDAELLSKFDSFPANPLVEGACDIVENKAIEGDDAFVPGVCTGVFLGLVVGCVLLYTCRQFTETRLGRAITPILDRPEVYLLLALFGGLYGAIFGCALQGHAVAGAVLGAVVAVVASAVIRRRLGRRGSQAA